MPSFDNTNLLALTMAWMVEIWQWNTTFFIVGVLLAVFAVERFLIAILTITGAYNDGVVRGYSRGAGNSGYVAERRSYFEDNKE